MRMAIKISSTNLRVYEWQTNQNCILAVSLDSNIQVTIEHAANILKNFPPGCQLKLNIQGKIQDNLVEDNTDQNNMSASIFVSRQSIQFQAMLIDGEYISQPIPLKELARLENKGGVVQISNDNKGD
ncbi:hypothetical protein AB6D11_00435 [Vibrio splendidus]